MIVIIDYKCGNIASVANMITKVGAEAIISNDPEIISNASKLILPGVGAFSYGMEQLDKLNLKNVIINHVKENKHLLGICLGMQLLANHSEEGDVAGLNLIDSEIVKFNFQNNIELPIPHVGWNTVSIEKENKLVDKSLDFRKYYFVHSYHMICKNLDNIIGITKYGFDFPSIVSNNINVYGVQFHPEKSHSFGIKLMTKFVQM